MKTRKTVYIKNVGTIEEWAVFAEDRVQIMYKGSCRNCIEYCNYNNYQYLYLHHFE